MRIFILHQHSVDSLVYTKYHGILAAVAGAVILITDGLFAELVLMSKVMKIDDNLEIRAPL